jgi:hypothetical protein
MTADGPATLPGTLALVSLTEDDAAGSVAAAVEATNSLVRGWLTPAPDGEWAPHHRYGANLLAGRLWRRKDSPGGMMQFGMEAAVYVAGNWPDVALMLGLGEYRVPRVG